MPILCRPAEEQNLFLCYNFFRASVRALPLAGESAFWPETDEYGRYAAVFSQEGGVPMSKIPFDPKELAVAKKSFDFFGNEIPNYT